MDSKKSTSLVLCPKKSKAIWMLLGCGVFVALGIWMAQDEGWIGYLCAGFVALGIPVAVLQLLPGSTYLRIAEDGLTFANMFRVNTIPWNVIDRFFVVSLKRGGLTVHEMVGFNFVPSYDRTQVGRRVASAIAQCEGALPDTYGKKANELANMLNGYILEFSNKRGEQSDAPEPLAR